MAWSAASIAIEAIQEFNSDLECGRMSECVVDNIINVMNECGPIIYRTYERT